MQRDPSLPTLLRDEQLYGTRERDPFVPRNDMYYFPSTKSYILVEDSTGEHRPIVVKEYDRPRKNEVPSWPVLWGGIEGRTGFYYYDGPEITYERRVPPRPAPAPAASGKAGGGGGGFGSTAARAVAPNLRRAVSLQNVARGQQATYGYAGYEPVGGRRDSYIAASGNSQIITSNIQSATSTAARSGAAQASRFGNPYVDKRLAVLSNRTVSVAGGSILGSGSTAAGGSSGAGSGGRVAALKRSERPGALKRSLSVDGHLARVPNPPARDEPKKAGYCENCRVKYDCFREHVRSSKHRRFALNPKNWADLDKLLERIARKPLGAEEWPRADELVSSELAAEDEGEYEDSGYFDASVLAGDEEDCDDDEADSAQDDGDEDEAMEADDDDEEEIEEEESSRPLEAQVLAQAVRA